jgi:cell division control protein 45
VFGGSELGDAEERREQRRQRKRKRTGPTPEEKHALREAKRIPRERRRRLREYYHSDSYGQAAAYLLFDLAQKRGKDTNDALWLAIVGVTDQFIHARIDQVSYFFFNSSSSAACLLCTKVCYDSLLLLPVCAA